MFLKRQELANSFPQAGNVRASQAAAYLGIGLSTFWRKVAKGEILKPTKLGARVSVWEAEYIRKLATKGIPAMSGRNV